MAIFKSPLLGNTKKSVGNTTMYVNKGQNILRSKPASINDAKSEAQLQVRSNMALGVGLYQSLTTLVNLGFVKGKQTQSPYNRFISQFQKNMTDNGTGVRSTDLSNMALSNGNLIPILSLLAELKNDKKTIEITWSDSNQLDNTISQSQQMGLAVVCGNKVVGLSVGKFKRSTQIATIVTNLTGEEVDPIYVYAFAYVTGVNSSPTSIVQPTI